MKRLVSLKKIISLILSLIVILCVGCSNNVNNSYSNESNNVKITDQANRTVLLPENVNRVISCYYTVTSTLIALGQKDKLVGIEMNADKREIYKRAAPEILNLPAVGNSKTLNVETCASLNPDLVIIPDRLINMIDQLELAGLNVIVVSPENDLKLLEMFELLGNILGNNASSNSKKLISYYNERLDFINSLNFENTPSVYITGNSSYLTTATSSMFQTHLISLSGGKSVSIELNGEFWTNITSEQVALWNPDFIFMPNGKSFSEDAVKSDTGFKTTSALENDNIYEIPSSIESWDYPTPSVILGMLWATSKLHKDLVSSQDVIDEAKYFYNTFYNINVADEEVGYDSA